MSDKEVFLAHVVKLVAWLRTCGLDRVKARSDVSVEDYSQDFVVWLIARFPIWQGLPSTRPDTWIRNLEAACRGLHEVRSLDECKLLLVEMTDDGAEAPFVQHQTYRDVRGVLNIEFICAKVDEGGGLAQTVKSTHLGTPGRWMQARCMYGGISSSGQKLSDTYHNLDDLARGVNGGANNTEYGISSTMCMGEFEECNYSEYTIFFDSSYNTSFTVHRISRPASGHEPASTSSAEQAGGQPAKQAPLAAEQATAGRAELLRRLLILHSACVHSHGLCRSFSLAFVCLHLTIFAGGVRAKGHSHEPVRGVSLKSRRSKRV